MHLDLLPSFQIVKLIFSIAMDRTEPCCVGLNVTAQGHIVSVDSKKVPGRAQSLSDLMLKVNSARPDWGFSE